MTKNSKKRSFNPAHDVFSACTETTVSALSDVHLGVKGRATLAGGKKKAYSGTISRDMMKHLARSSDHLVLNGDIYEFIYPKEEKAALRNRAQDFLTDLINICEKSGCHLHYVVGNHDDNIKFVEMMEAMEKPDVFFSPCGGSAHWHNVVRTW